MVTVLVVYWHHARVGVEVWQSVSHLFFIFILAMRGEELGVRGAERPRQLTRNTHRTPRPEKRRGTSRQPPPAPDIPAPDSRCVGGEEQSPGSRS